MLFSNVERANGKIGGSSGSVQAMYPVLKYIEKNKENYFK
jgi:hypothetical protein